MLPELLTLTPPADEERLSRLTHNTVVQIDSQPHQRDKPQSAVLRRAVRLSAPESEKHVCQIVLDIRGTGYIIRPVMRWVFIRKTARSWSVSCWDCFGLTVLSVSR